MSGLITRSFSAIFLLSAFCYAAGHDESPNAERSSAPVKPETVFECIKGFLDPMGSGIIDGSLDKNGVLVIPNSRNYRSELIFLSPKSGGYTAAISGPPFDQTDEKHVALKDGGKEAAIYSYRIKYTVDGNTLYGFYYANLKKPEASYADNMSKTDIYGSPLELKLNPADNVIPDVVRFIEGSLETIKAKELKAYEYDEKALASGQTKDASLRQHFLKRRNGLRECVKVISPEEGKKLRAYLDDLDKNFPLMTKMLSAPADDKK